ncbi:hypothetical protein CC85DRAFT_77675 [Cutaneotrichosporon oleaginosum]|uniref:Uncharacterized protein n=1 Tax=Cutaneotrichosporon oleaginosum TaxID=879819 RepID=A0A0J1B4W0_9TREE|nr:uncharacterized protein CC85DRAFT_77675 [Cutaneotrichosporon oleaginosum]KLT42719.1 hypothetical protein CC85DRAFT_77675 [Cutaneotrichosporon oleaginosum]
MNWGMGAPRIGWYGGEWGWWRAASLKGVLKVESRDGRFNRSNTTSTVMTTSQNVERRRDHCCTAPHHISRPLRRGAGCESNSDVVGGCIQSSHRVAWPCIIKRSGGSPMSTSGRGGDGFPCPEQQLHRSYFESTSRPAWRSSRPAKTICRSASVEAEEAFTRLRRAPTSHCSMRTRDEKLLLCEQSVYWSWVHQACHPGLACACRYGIVVSDGKRAKLRLQFHAEINIGSSSFNDQ